MEKIKIAIVGAKGKMGSAVCKRLSRNFDIVEICKGDSFGDFLDVQVVIDFGSGSSSAESAKWCARKGIPLIIGSTGQSVEEMKTIERAATKTSILKAGNFSIGIFVMKKLIDVVLKHRVQDVVVLEKHHREKKDNPSGTALELKAHIEKQAKVKDVFGLRGGKEIGMHEVDFYLENELISIKHQAFSREAFVDGVEKTVQFMLKPRSIGMYDFSDVLSQWYLCKKMKYRFDTFTNFWDNICTEG